MLKDNERNKQLSEDKEIQDTLAKAKQKEEKKEKKQMEIQKAEWYEFSY